MQYMSYDGEDAGEMGAAENVCHFVLAGKDNDLRLHAEDTVDIHIGYAKAMQAAPTVGRFALQKRIGLCQNCGRARVTRGKTET